MTNTETGTETGTEKTGTESTGTETSTEKTSTGKTSTETGTESQWPPAAPQDRATGPRGQAGRGGPSGPRAKWPRKRKIGEHNVQPL